MHVYTMYYVAIRDEVPIGRFLAAFIKKCPRWSCDSKAFEKLKPNPGKCSFVEYNEQKATDMHASIE